MFRLPAWPQVASAGLRGRYRTSPEAFRVHERMTIEPDGAGEHLLCEVEKRGMNTADVAARLGRIVGIKAPEVGFCGAKDRHAVTRQWFSLRDPKGAGWPEGGPEAEENEDGSSWRLLGSARHGRKLRRGDHAGNRFELLLELAADAGPTDVDDLAERLASGVPNYFGPQRFGREASNLARARRWIEDGARLPGRGAQRGYLLSAARSLLFNEVVAARVRAGVLDQLVEGDVADAADASVASAPLWGRGRSAASGAAAELEEAALAPWRAWCDALEHVGLAHERRPVLLRPEELTVSLEGRTLQLAFTLPPGAFATALLPALGHFEDATTGAAALGTAA